ncbi:MAG: hypothetical protein LUD26_15280 [Bacteroides uniformis]|nr:hypothetical protein [Bacteroides uniformis]
MFLHQGPVPDVKDEDVNVIHVFLQMFPVVIGQVGEDDRVAKAAAQVVIHPVTCGHEV